MTIAEELMTNLRTSAEEVFDTMVFKPLVRLPEADPEPARTGTNVVATVAFAGHRRGLVSIHSSIDAARSIACAMLGIPEDEVLARFVAMRDRGVLRRVGAVPNHYALGWRANGMTVWDVDDARICAPVDRRSVEAG